MVIAYIIGSVLLVSFISLVGILLLKKRLSQGVLVSMLSLSAGTLLGGAFLHLLPEASEDGFSISIAFSLLVGFLIFFLLEKWIHFHHHEKESVGHGHAYHLGILNITGDAIHNILDGLVIAGAYLADVQVGVAATFAVILHEIPQELADYGVLLYSGFSRKKALLFNLFTGLTAVIGAGIGILLKETDWFIGLILPFAAGSFLYIAASSLVPELHKHCKMRETVIHVGMMALGIALMYGILFLE